MTIKNTNDEQTSSTSTEVLAFKDVYKDYPDGDTTVHALAPTTCTIHAGEFVAVVGPSGSGKSTLLTIMGGLQQPTGGSVSLDGKEYSRMSRKELAQLRFSTVGFVLQSSNLVPFLTLEEQLKLHSSYAHEKYDARRAASLMEDLDIEKLRGKYPDELSGGEKQRAAICVALYGRPAVILADEPTASLDTSRAMGVADIFAQATRREHTAVVMVTHDERLLGECDRVLTIQDGKLQESTPEQASQQV
ncbi:ABC transporter ATP-binding protein [Bifidobacterium crudilactis]|jgi:putative ABC transport system ATP-binding protein|uniref:ABC transporter ATP-binding protein n=1 Tax=Bifidobacterium crudilactis TaxID=327277 RepID=UPI00068E0CF9|nr:ABC transporter ATP-binding protein [Bifidobacterium crudilactis]MCI2148778.1 ABC transporter ATP-binding protein [Bifidobacterium crudilactis]MCI2158074.1 ABC transporter ATP-binding protein [Bifidobacterium crudilactis]